MRHGERADTAEVGQNQSGTDSKGYPAEVVDEAILIYASDMQEQKAYGEKRGISGAVLSLRGIWKRLSMEAIYRIIQYTGRVDPGQHGAGPHGKRGSGKPLLCEATYLQAYESGAPRKG